jgi:hypothetical protein
LRAENSRTLGVLDLTKLEEGAGQRLEEMHTKTEQSGDVDEIVLVLTCMLQRLNPIERELSNYENQPIPEHEKETNVVEAHARPSRGTSSREDDVRLVQPEPEPDRAPKIVQREDKKRREEGLPNKTTLVMEIMRVDGGAP